MPQTIQTTYQHIQTIPASVWQVNHNLNNYPIIDVMVYENGTLQKIIPKDILIIDMNNCEVHFSSNRTGQARMV